MANTSEARAPGKLFVAGEYAVVEPGEPAILVAVDRYLTVRAVPTPEPRHPSGGAVFSGEYPAPREFLIGGTGGARFLDEQADYLSAAVSAVEALRETRGKPALSYDLHVSSELTENGRKLGLGSSGAVVVATIAALAHLHGLGLSTRERFRLALCAVVQISPKASGGDVAASTYGGWIRYTSPDRDRVAAACQTAGVAETIAAPGVWAGCEVTHLPDLPVPMLVGWTKAPADTGDLVAQVRSRPRPANSTFFADSAAITAKFVDVAASRGAEDSAAAVIEAIREARGILTRLSAATGTEIETEALARLSDVAERHGGAGKSSGAGGGDCGIAFAPSAEAAGKILQEWHEATITALPLRPHPPEGDHP